MLVHQRVYLSNSPTISNPPFSSNFHYFLTDQGSIPWVIKCPHFSHHPTIRYMVYNGYYKVISNIPKMGHLPTPESQGGLFQISLREPVQRSPRDTTPPIWHPKVSTKTCREGHPTMSYHWLVTGVITQLLTGYIYIYIYI